MNDALRMLARRWRRLGWPGALGAGLMAGAAVFYLAALAPAYERLDELRAATLARRDELRRDAVLHAAGDAPDDQLVRFHRAFPVDTSLPEWLDKMFVVAARQGIALDQGDYKLTRNAVGKLVRIQIALPVRSNYSQIRKFLAGLRAEMPVVALEHVEFERQKVSDPIVDATIKLALYMEPSS